jgi:hypothetical protein
MRGSNVLLPKRQINSSQWHFAAVGLICYGYNWLWDRPIPAIRQMTPFVILPVRNGKQIRGKRTALYLWRYFIGKSGKVWRNLWSWQPADVQGSHSVLFLPQYALRGAKSFAIWQTLSWSTDSPTLLWNTDIHNRVHNSRHWIISWDNCIKFILFTSYFLKIYFSFLSHLRLGLRNSFLRVKPSPSFDGPGNISKIYKL